MNRFSVLYLLRDQYYHLGCSTHAEAQTVLQTLAANPYRTPVGIYDAKTELIEWEPGRQADYEQASIEEQGRLAEQTILIVQALRRRDASGHPTSGFRRPSLFA